MDRRKSWAAAEYERDVYGPCAQNILLERLTGYAVIGPWVKLVVVSWAFSSLPLFFLSCAKR